MSWFGFDYKLSRNVDSSGLFAVVDFEWTLCVLIESFSLNFLHYHHRHRLSCSKNRIIVSILLCVCFFSSSFYCCCSCRCYCSLLHWIHKWRFMVVACRDSRFICRQSYELWAFATKQILVWFTYRVCVCAFYIGYWLIVLSAMAGQ